jgi:hypothetical protein
MKGGYGKRTTYNAEVGFKSGVEEDPGEGRHEHSTIGDADGRDAKEQLD